ncbi:hypothetical protein HYR69_07725 [Candidatus Sumerlaeota bacterium]|nr:hypothetical protein [Candidatus Sumerlaeota bacterium]
MGALIRRTHIETVMSDQREATHEVIFEVQNNREQYLELRLPEGMKIWSAFVRGKPVRPTLREKDKANLIELTKSETKDAAFRVRLILRETLPGGELGYWGKLHFVPPQPLNIPVLRTTWKLYLPPRWRYLKFSGGMRLADRPGLPWIEPAAELLLNDLPADVAGGIAKPALRPQQAVVSTQYQNEETEEEKRARLQGAALEIPIVREGLQYEFNKLSGVGDIEIKYWKSKALVILQGCFALAILFALLWSMAARRRLRPAVTMSAATFILASLTDGLAGRLSATALTASCAALAAAIIIVILRRTAESLRDRKSAVKEPLLHPAPVTPWFPPDLPISPDPAQPEVPSAANGDSAEDNPDDGPEDAKEDGGGEKPPRKKRKA